jgi:uncharacterized membrane protein YoaK (UPF0700 family)
VSIPSRVVAGILAGEEDRHGGLPLLLVLLTMVSGLLDAVSYLRLDHVFVANMTGNVVFLGLAAADARELSIAGTLAAIMGFVAGALAGGRLGARLGRHRGRLLAAACLGNVVLEGAAMIVVSAAPLDPAGTMARYLLILLLSLPMGLQNATAHRLGVRDLNTTVLTVTLAALTADSRLAGGAGPRHIRRAAAVVAMLLGAALGGLLIFHVGVVAVLGLAAALTAATGIAAWRLAPP